MSARGIMKPRSQILAAVLLLGACRAEDPASVRAAQAGAAAIRDYGCGACHRIPGIAGADGNVGPTLENLAARVYLAGFLPNTPDNLVRWLQAPQQFAPLTAMPDMAVNETDARAMAAYLGGLR